MVQHRGRGRQLTQLSLPTAASVHACVSSSCTDILWWSALLSIMGLPCCAAGAHITPSLGCSLHHTLHGVLSQQLQLASNGHMHLQSGVLSSAAHYTVAATDACTPICLQEWSVQQQQQHQQNMQLPAGLQWCAEPCHCHGAVVCSCCWHCCCACRSWDMHQHRLAQSTIGWTILTQQSTEQQA
jgi:hypothetical protein